LDIAKNVFQVHGIDAAEKVVVRKRLRRSQVIAFFAALPPCLVGMEACATAHYWARELTKLGHEVRLMPAKDVKAYVKRNKNDAADAHHWCERYCRHGYRPECLPVGALFCCLDRPRPTARFNRGQTEAWADLEAR
jgi:transposase